MRIPISRPQIGAEELQAVAAVFESGQLASGPSVEEFESAFASMVGTRHAVAVGSGSAALFVGLRAAGVEANDEVIVPSFTFAATANAIRMCGAVPVFIDVDPETFCVTADGVADAITPATVGVMPVHLYGRMAPMDEITAAADNAGIDVYEDAAQAHGASWKDQPAGSWGRFGAFSFYPTKNMTTGEGGMITTDDADLADSAHLLRNQGMRHRYQHEVVGLNERMTEMEAAVGLVQLSKLEAWNERRRQNAAHYHRHLSASLRPPREPEHGVHVYHQFTLSPQDRGPVLEALEAASIGYGIYYARPTHAQRPYATAGVSLPITELLAQRVVSIPVRPDLTDEELAYIVSTLNGAIS